MSESESATTVSAPAGASDAVVASCRAVRAGYGRIVICPNIDLEIHQGEFLAVLGPNGGGKTTLLGALAGTTQLGGDVTLKGHSITKLSTAKRARAGLALVPEARRNIFPTMTVAENLALGADLAPRAGRAERAAEIFDLFPILLKYRGQFSGNLSGGEQQMLAIGMALASEPALLVLDEPSQGLAPSVLKTVAESLHRLRQTGITVLMAEQNHAFAARLADRFVVLVHGEVVASGGPAELADREMLARAYLDTSSAR
jgi:branched-chain amino acid transport system ATP-binding protein